LELEAGRPVRLGTPPRGTGSFVTQS